MLPCPQPVARNLGVISDNFSSLKLGKTLGRGGGSVSVQGGGGVGNHQLAKHQTVVESGGRRLMEERERCDEWGGKR